MNTNEERPWSQLSAAERVHQRQRVVNALELARRVVASDAAAEHEWSLRAAVAGERRDAEALDVVETTVAAHAPCWEINRRLLKQLESQLAAIDAWERAHPA